MKTRVANLNILFKDKAAVKTAEDNLKALKEKEPFKDLLLKMKNAKAALVKASENAKPKKAALDKL